MAPRQARGVSGVERAAAEEVKAWMARRGISQTELAGALGFAQPNLSARLQGRTAFTLRDLARVAAYLDVNLMQLLGPVGTAKLIRGDESTEKAPSPSGEEASRLAPPTGLEPVTLRLTVECSAN